MESVTRDNDAGERYMVFTADGKPTDGFAYLSLGLATAEADVVKGYVRKLIPAEIVADFRDGAGK